MTPLYTDQEFKNCKSREKLPLKCKQCKKTFYISKHKLQGSKNSNKIDYDYCSLKCSGKQRQDRIIIPCKNCNKLLEKYPSVIKSSKNGNVFCNRSCAAT